MKSCRTALQPKRHPQALAEVNARRAHHYAANQDNKASCNSQAIELKKSNHYDDTFRN